MTKKEKMKGKEITIAIEKRFKELNPDVNFSYPVLAEYFNKAYRNELAKETFGKAYFVNFKNKNNRPSKIKSAIFASYLGIDIEEIHYYKNSTVRRIPGLDLTVCNLDNLSLKFHRIMQKTVLLGDSNATAL